MRVGGDRGLGALMERRRRTRRWERERLWGGNGNRRHHMEQNVTGACKWDGRELGEHKAPVSFAHEDEQAPPGVP